ncbi:hypothetical protein KSS87_001064 [Heliosperma pusillum]|nr:hypothetical protein KSS87_001064 [Heliosperma pusillum]
MITHSFQLLGIQIELFRFSRVNGEGWAHSVSSLTRTRQAGTSNQFGL